MSQSWKTKIDNDRSTYPAVDTIPQVIDDVKFRGRKSVDDSIEKEPYSYLSDDRIMQAQPWIKDVKALEKLAKLFSKYMDEQRVAVQETTQERNQGGVRYARNESFSNQIDEVLNNTYDRNNLIYMSNTPIRLQQILGLKKLPMLITPKHVYTICVSKAKAISKKRFSQRVLSKTHFHNLGKSTLCEIPELLNKPLVIIKSTTKSDDSRAIICK